VTSVLIEEPWIINQFLHLAFRVTFGVFGPNHRAELEGIVELVRWRDLDFEILEYLQAGFTAVFEQRHGEGSDVQVLTGSAFCAAASTTGTGAAPHTATRRAVMRASNLAFTSATPVSVACSFSTSAAIVC
jgi:hypothetical protein